MAQVLSSLLRGDLSLLEDLPPNIRNQALLDLAKLASEGKLSGKIDIILNNNISLIFFFAGEMQEKVLTELAQNLSSLPPDMRAKGKCFTYLKTSLSSNIKGKIESKL
jgi:hypothetical protein